MISKLKAFPALCAAAALSLAALPGRADAAVYTFDVTGTVANASLSTSGELNFLNIALDGFSPVTLEVGDELVFNLMLDEVLTVPASLETFFGVDLFGNQDPVGEANESSSTITFLDGSLSGQSFSSFCGNCLAAIGSGSPFASFDFQSLTATILITSLEYSTEITSADFRYQLKTAVPEPATWAMLITGFAGVGAALRRRRRPALLTA